MRAAPSPTCASCALAPALLGWGSGICWSVCTLPDCLSGNSTSVVRPCNVSECVYLLDDTRHSALPSHLTHDPVDPGVCAQIVDGMVEAGMKREDAMNRFVVCSSKGAIGREDGKYGDPNHKRGL